MLCISIAQESRRLAVVDLLNAGPQCDLVEVHLDRFKNAPHVRDLVAAKRNPLIFSCRRTQDGGQWEGSEEERLALLRQAVVDGANYIDIELDVADKIRPFPGCKRIITIHDPLKEDGTLAERYAQAADYKPDYIRVNTKAGALEEALPLLKLLVRPRVPTVVNGVGKAGMMVNLMARKLGAPWIYAALERGMEAYPEQATVQELERVYQVRSLGPKTHLFGIAGLSEREYALLAGLNAALNWHGAETRCWPFRLDDVTKLAAVARQFRLTGVLAGFRHTAAATDQADVLDPLAEQTRVVDLLLPDETGLRGTSTLGAAVVEELAARIQEHSGARRPLEGRTVMTVGTSPLARLIARSVEQKGAIPIVSSRDPAHAKEAAKALNCRHVPYEGLYSTLHDVLIVCEDAKLEKTAAHRVANNGPVRPGYLRPGMAVVDMSDFPRMTELLDGAAERGGVVIEPHRILSREVGILLWELCGQEMDFETLESLMMNLEPAGVA